MAKKGLTIAFAESATAGWLCSELALTEESGLVLKGGITCYDASLKVSLLKVPQKLIDLGIPCKLRSGTHLRSIHPLTKQFPRTISQ